MATPSKIVLDPSVKPVFGASPRADSAKLASELLQRDLETHHVFFNSEGFHNHIPHHLLSLYALGASPEQIQAAYDENNGYQRKPIRDGEKVHDKLDDPAVWKRCLQKEKYYHDFVVYFQRRLEQTSIGEVLNEYLFAGDERAEDMLVRLHAGFLHPMIQLGFGVEFEQPAVVAEGLAQAAVHDRWIGDLLLPAEEAARKSGKTRSEASVAELLDECRGNEKLRTAAHWSDANKIRDGVMKRAPDEALAILAKVVVGEDEIEEKMAEMMNASLYFTSTAQRATKVPKIDFYYMHCVNSAIFYPRLLGASSPLSGASKRRLLEWKIRMDIGMYISRRTPELRLQDVTDYPNSQKKGWDGLIAQFDALKGDDGHAIKLLRAVAATREACAPFEGEAASSGKKEKNARFRISGDDYLQVARLVVDSVDGDRRFPADEPKWVRSAGFDQAWEHVPDRDVAVL